MVVTILAYPVFSLNTIFWDIFFCLEAVNYNQNCSALYCVFTSVVINKHTDM